MDLASKAQSSTPATCDHGSHGYLPLGDFPLLDKLLLLDAGVRYSPEISDRARGVLLLHIAAIREDVRRLGELLTGDDSPRPYVPVPASIRASEEPSREC